MKTVSVLFLIFGICFGTLMAQKRRIPAGAQKSKQVLFDFRVERTDGPPKVPAATQRTVLSRVFRRFLSDPSRCNPRFDPSSSNDPLQAARNAGQIAPLIADTATGSFTGTGRSETAYTISVSECNATHADNFGTKRIAIFSGSQLVADMDLDFMLNIARKTDLNGDGVDELLMTNGDMHQGTLIEMAALLEFQNGRRRVIEDFGTVLEDDCASLRPGSSRRASVLYLENAAPGSMPRMRIENYKAGCGTGRGWRFFSTGKMQGQ